MTWRATGVAEATLLEGTMREVLVGGRSVVLARIGRTVVAFEGYCPHQGGLLAEGRLEGHRITCPVHEAAFDLPSGRVVADPFGVVPPEGGVGPLPTFAVRTVRGSVEIELADGPT
jgi:nitrite reductase/ring-hydroxylating ferredoxin subunit